MVVSVFVERELHLLYTTLLIMSVINHSYLPLRDYLCYGNTLHTVIH
jgi:hypothetical protein